MTPPTIADLDRRTLLVAAAAALSPFGGWAPPQHPTGPETRR
ncbi:MAG: hypothetical protein WD969_15550 [Paracoccaceae bacterium]